MTRQAGIFRAVIALTTSRIVVNMTRRFAYPFVPGIARQLAIPAASVQSVIALQGSSGLISPFLAPLIERFRRKTVMLAALALMAAAAFTGALLPTALIFAAVMFLFGLSKSVYDPTMYAYMGDNIPYNRRGVALGFGELSWAAGLLLGAPLAGLLLSRTEVTPAISRMTAAAFSTPITFLSAEPGGLQAMLALLGLLSLAAIAIVALFVPFTAHRRTSQQRLRDISPAVIVRTLRGNPSAIGAVIYAFMLAVANEIVFINYGLFMESSFDLALVLLGAVTIVISVAEVTGEMIVILLADRVGKRRLALVGAGASTLCYLVLPFTASSLAAALLLLFLIFVGVETAIVSSLPLFTELLPDNRVIMMSTAAGMAAFGRVMGGILGGLIYSFSGSFIVTAWAAALMGTIAFVALWRGVVEQGTPTDVTLNPLPAEPGA